MAKDPQWIRMALVLLLSLLILQCVLSYDFYMIRHGARAPISNNLPLVFGVPKQQLTLAGRSQAFYLGREFRIRHSNIRQADLIVHSTNVSRTKETAQFFLKGWYGLVPISPPGSSDEFVKLKATPQHLPPIQLSFKPRPVFALIKWFQFRSKVKVLQGSEKHPINLLPQTEYEKAMYKEFRRSSMCAKAEFVAPNICSKMNPYFLISDLITCLKFEGLRIPNMTRAEEELAHTATDIYYSRKYGCFCPPDPYYFQSLSRFLSYLETGHKRLVLEFTHDTNIFAVLRVLLGFDHFKSLLGPHLIIDYMAVLRLRVRDKTVQLFFNDKEVPLKRCFQEGDTVCRMDTFIRLTHQAELGT